MKWIRFLLGIFVLLAALDVYFGFLGIVVGGYVPLLLIISGVLLILMTFFGVIGTAVLAPIGGGEGPKKPKLTIVLGALIAILGAIMFFMPEMLPIESGVIGLAVAGLFFIIAGLKKD